VSKSVCTIKDIQITITNYIFKDDKYKTMTLVVRGNDFNSTPPTAVAEIGDIYAKMSESSVCRRIQFMNICLGLISSDVTEKITAVNTGFQVTCDAKGVIFADDTSSLYLRDWSHNHQYLQYDGVI